MALYAGIDVGTSGVRIAVIDRDRHCRAQAACSFDPAATNWADVWWQAVYTLLAGLERDDRANLRAIAVNGTSSTVLLCDAAGQPITAPLLYNDASGAPAVDALRNYLAPLPATAASGRDIVLSATSSLVKLLWWRQQPIFAQARYLLHQADWLGFRLHGQLGLSDYHNSLKLGYDVMHLCYPDWLTQLDVMPLLPRVVAPGTPIGPVLPVIAQALALPSDCLVCAGTTDSIAAFLASGATASGAAVTSLGSTLVLKLLSDTPVENGNYGIYSHRLGDRWLVGGASNTGGAVLQQFFTTTELVALSERIPVDQASPLDYYPLLRPGERFPINDAQLPPRLEPRPDDPVTFLHGLLESMARIEATGYALLQTLGASPLKHVYTAGGGAQNAVWTAIRARHLGVPVTRSRHTEAAYGTALLALSGSQQRTSESTTAEGA